jgi:hypothetical protein
MLTAKPEEPSIKPRPRLPLPPVKKQWPRPLKAGALCLIASVSLHGLLLKLPLVEPTAEPEPELTSEPLPEPDTVAVTLLPAPAAPPEPVPAAPAPTAVQPAPAPAVAAPPSRMPAPVSPEAPLPEVAPEAPLEDVPLATDPPEVQPPDPDAEADFPHLPGATAGCLNSEACWRSPVDSWRAAATALRTQLESQGYTLIDRTDSILGDDAGARIYAVLRDGSPAYYLNVISVAEGILYKRTEAPMAAEEIAAIDRFSD